MLTTNKKREEGFTIIEVMIVLAIAGLIMLVVFLAVPALQRNSRNTGRKNDVGRIANAVSEWQSNNNGRVFTAGAGNANLTAIVNSAGDLNQYTLTPAGSVGANSLTVVTGNQGALPAGANDVNLGSIQIVTGAVCSTNGETDPSTSNRRMVVQYLLENQGGVTPMCQEV